MECSIIIPSYNYGEYLAECIESALAQTVPCEVILVDDGSTDDSLEVAERYSGDITVLKQENLGVSAARNRAVSKATSEWILPLDADDVLFPEGIESLLSLPYGIRTGSSIVFGNRPDRRYRFRQATLERMLESCRIPQCSMYPRQGWVDVDGYDENLRASEDWDFWVRLLAYGYEHHCGDKLVYKFRQHGYSLTQWLRDNQDELRRYVFMKWKEQGIKP